MFSFDLSQSFGLGVQPYGTSNSKCNGTYTNCTNSACGNSTNTGGGCTNNENRCDGSYNS